MISKINSWKWLALFSLIILAAGCDNSLARHEEDFSDGCWAIADTLDLMYENTDPNLKVMVTAPITFTGEYAFNNLYLRMVAIAPSGQVSVLPYEYELMDVQGDWYGDISGDNASFVLPLSVNQVFPETGTYRFRIYHFMQTELLCGVSKAGITVMPGE